MNICEEAKVNMMKFVALFSGAGLAIPILFSVMWWLGLKNIVIPTIWQNVLLLFWPSYIGMMATAGATTAETLKMLVISIVVNIVLYTLIGFLVWWGLNKCRWLLYAVGISIMYGWYKLLML
jgi:hypothetical protein